MRYRRCWCDLIYLFALSIIGNPLIIPFVTHPLANVLPDSITSFPAYWLLCWFRWLVWYLVFLWRLVFLDVHPAVLSFLREKPWCSLSFTIMMLRIYWIAWFAELCFEVYWMYFSNTFFDRLHVFEYVTIVFQTRVSRLVIESW